MAGKTNDRKGTAKQVQANRLKASAQQYKGLTQAQKNARYQGVKQKLALQDVKRNIAGKPSKSKLV
jgi:hypothetical protein